MEKQIMKHAANGIKTDGKQASDVSEWMYAMPGILLCCSVLVMLVLDCISADMADKQYEVFPLLCRSVMAVSYIMLLVQALRRRPGLFRRPDLTGILFAAFVLCMIISTCINGWTREAILSVPYRFVGVLDLAVFIAVYMLCSRRVSSAGLRNAVLICFMLTADLVCAAFLYDWFVKDIPAIGSENAVSAVFFHDNHYGYFLVIAVMISAGYFIYGKTASMLIGLVSFAANMLALAVNRTSGCFIAAGFTLVIMIIYTVIRNRKNAGRALFLAVVLLAGAVFLVAASKALRDDLILLADEFIAILRGGDTTYAGHGRWQLWKITADYISDEPLFGYGCEGLADTLYDYTGIANPHCEPLTYAASFGIPAALIYTAGCLSAVIAGLKKHRTAETDADNTEYSRVIAAFASLGYFVSSLFGVAIFYTAPFLYILMGLASSRDSADVVQADAETGS